MEGTKKKEGRVKEEGGGGEVDCHTEREDQQTASDPQPVHLLLPSSRTDRHTQQLRRSELRTSQLYAEKNTQTS